jgi:phage I-like protein
MGRHPRAWERVRAEKPLDGAMVARWEWLDDALARVAQARLGQGASPEEIDAAYERAEVEAAGAADDDVLTELKGFVAALGGRVEARRGQSILAAFGSEGPLDLGAPACR